MKTFRWIVVIVLVLSLSLPAMTANAAANNTARLNVSMEPLNCTMVSEIPQAECEALVTLYIMGGGESWTINTNWLATTSPCSWYGVTCAGGHVTELKLVSNKLTGFIPFELGDLTGLTYLNLAVNGLSLSIPTNLGNLTNLTFFDLGWNQLTGSIPSELGNLTKLTYFAVGRNQLSGSIPATLGSLTNLTEMYFDGNLFTGNIPASLGNLTKLTTLWFHSTQLAGVIPPELGNLVQLTSLKVEDTFVSGSMPDGLQNLSGLHEFTFPSAICVPNTPAFTAWIAEIATHSTYTLCKAAGTAALSLGSFNPDPVLIGTDFSFTLGISVTDINPGVGGAELYLGYNPGFVAPPSTPGVSAVEVTPDFFGVANVSINEALPAGSCPGSTGPCVHVVLAGPAQVTQSGIAARFHFRGMAEGNACFSVLKSVLVDANGYQVEHSTPADQCVDVTSRTVEGAVLRQGVVANPNAGGGSQACTLVLVVAPSTSTLTSVDGGFHFSNLATGTYTFRASYPGYLDAEKAGVVVDASSLLVDLGVTALRGGDVNGDKAINILDIGKIISMFGQANVAVKSASTNCSGSDEATDINDDGNINISDLAIASGNWGSVSPAAWAK